MTRQLLIVNLRKAVKMHIHIPFQPPRPIYSNNGLIVNPALKFSFCAIFFYNWIHVQKIDDQENKSDKRKEKTLYTFYSAKTIFVFLSKLVWVLLNYWLMQFLEVKSHDDSHSTKFWQIRYSRRWRRRGSEVCLGFKNTNIND